jgi:predicted ATPase
MSKYEKNNTENKNTLIINLVAGPGTGKSTTMAGVFYKLKSLGIDCEMVTEFAKELVWENRSDTMKDELYIFAKQAHRIFRVNGQVDVIITDRPLILTVLYNNRYGEKSKELDALVASTFEKYNNLNYFLERTKDYNPNGRNQTEDEANEISEGLKEVMLDYGYTYKKLPADESVVDIIVKDVLEILQ